MAKRTLNDLQKQYNSYAAATQSSPMRGPGGPAGPADRARTDERAAQTQGRCKKVIRRLLSYIGSYKYLLLVAFVFLILSTLAGTALPICSVRSSIRWSTAA